MTTTSPVLMRPSWTAAKAASSSSKTRAGPRNDCRLWPATFTTQPSGARLPFRITSPEVAAQEVHDQFAGAVAGRAFGSVRRWHAGEAHRGDAEKFADEGHRVGRKLPAAGARSRAG